jgi:hypothetical protein
MRTFIARLGIAILFIGGPAAISSFSQTPSQDMKTGAKEMGQAATKTTKKTAHKVKAKKHHMHKGSSSTVK